MPGTARIAVVGAGLMGHGIAQVFALAGHDVSIYDPVQASLDSVKSRILTNMRDLGDDPSAVERVRPTGELAAAVRDADYVVEAVLEDLALKQKLFVEIEQHVRPDTILASNTSVIPITRIMEGLADRSRALSAPTGGTRLIWCRWSRLSARNGPRSTRLTGPSPCTRLRGRRPCT